MYLSKAISSVLLLILPLRSSAASILNQYHKYLNTTNMTTKVLTRRQASDHLAFYPVRDMALFCSEADLRGHCTWYRATDSWCFNIHAGDINEAAGTLPGGLNKVTSAYVPWYYQCVVFAEKNCVREHDWTAIKPDETKLHLGKLVNHVESIYCQVLSFVCKDSKTGRPYAYTDLPPPPQCDTWFEGDPH